MRAVLDTNIIVSTFITPTGIPAAVYRRWEEGDFALVVSESLLREYGRVLNYPHIQRLHRLHTGQIAEAIQGFREAEVFANPGDDNHVVTADPDDDIVVACAVAGEADYIVSGDRHLLDLGEHQGIRVVRPAVFLALLDDERGRLG